MMSTDATKSNDQAVRDALVDVRRAAMRTKLFARIAGLLSVWVVAVVVVFVIDALWPLAVLLRCVIAMAAVAGLTMWVWRVAREVLGERRYDTLVSDANVIERRFDLYANPLVNAVFASSAAHTADDTFERTMAQRTVERGSRAVYSVAPSDAVDHKPARRNVRLLVAALVGITIATVVAPRIVVNQFLRFAAPFGDHPRFSLTRFEVHIEPTEPEAGGDVRVSTNISRIGRPVGQAVVVQLDASRRVLRRWRMRHDDTYQFSHGLVAVTEPITFHIESGGGRSQRCTIRPRPAARAQREPDGEREDPPDDEAAAASSELMESLDQRHRRLIARARELADRAQRMGNTAAQLRHLVAIATGTPTLSRKLERFDERIGQFGQRGNELAGEISGAGLQPAPLRLPDVRRSRYDQQGPGQWLNAVQSAAEHDARHLHAGIAALMAGIDGMVVSTGTGAVRAAADEPAATGVVNLHVDIVNLDAKLPDAVMQHVPVDYRHAVTRYFDRLARDAK